MVYSRYVLFVVESFKGLTPSFRNSRRALWVALQELKLSYHNPETRLFAIYPSYGNLKLSSLTATHKNETLSYFIDC